MKKFLIVIVAIFTVTAVADVTVNLSVVMSSEQVWALEQDYEDYKANQIAQTNPPLSKLQWFVHNATNQIHEVANRRLKIRKQELRQQLDSQWQSLTLVQMTNVLGQLPPLPPPE